MKAPKTKAPEAKLETAPRRAKSVRIQSPRRSAPGGRGGEIAPFRGPKEGCIVLPASGVGLSLGEDVPNAGGTVFPDRPRGVQSSLILTTERQVKQAPRRAGTSSPARRISTIAGAFMAAIKGPSQRAAPIATDRQCLMAPPLRVGGQVRISVAPQKERSPRWRPRAPRATD